MKICDVAKRSWSRRGVDIHKADGTEFSVVRERRTPHDGDTVRCRSDEQGVEPIPLRRLRPHWRRENVTGRALMCRGTGTRRGERLRGRSCLPSSVATSHVVHDERFLLGHERCRPRIGPVRRLRSSDLHHTGLFATSFSRAGRRVFSAAWTASVHYRPQAALKPRDSNSRALRTSRASCLMGIPDRGQRASLLAAHQRRDHLPADYCDVAPGQHQYTPPARTPPRRRPLTRHARAHSVAIEEGRQIYSWTCGPLGERCGPTPPPRS